MRRSSTSARAFLDSHWQGSKTAGTKFTDLWTFAEAVDLQLGEAHRTGGITAVNWLLSSSDTLEHMLARLGAEFTLQVSGDWTMFQSMLTSKPPGESHLMPEWAVEKARVHSKLEHQQAAWLRGEPLNADGEPTGAAARRRARGKAAPAGGKADTKGKGKDKGGKQGAAAAAPPG